MLPEANILYFKSMCKVALKDNMSATVHAATIGSYGVNRSVIS